MSRTELLKKLLPGFIPLFVFIVADEIWGTKIGLFVAVGVGLLVMVWIPLVDENGKVTGQAPRSLVHCGSKLMHPVVHLHVINHNKAILLQKRPISKQISILKTSKFNQTKWTKSASGQKTKSKTT